MKKTLLTLAFLAGLAISGSMAQNNEVALDNEFADEFYPVWQRASNYLLEVAELMPEDLYTYQPTEEIFTFSEQLIHIAANLYFLNASYITGEELQDLQLDADGKSKEEVIQILQEAIATVDTSYQTLASGEEDESVSLFNRIETNKKRVMLLMRDHMTHHRGQLIIYLRMNGIEPPAYVGW